jgi:hypothetical protein
LEPAAHEGNLANLHGLYHAVAKLAAEEGLAEGFVQDLGGVLIHGSKLIRGELAEAMERLIAVK